MGELEAALGAVCGHRRGAAQGLKSNVASEVKEVQVRASLRGRGRLAMAAPLSWSGSTWSKLASRWAALKPGKEMKGWSAAEVEAVFAALAGLEVADGHRQVRCPRGRQSCETFGLGKPAFEGLVAFEADYAETDSGLGHVPRGRDGAVSAREPGLESLPRAHV